jgi:dihydroxyacetone kinase
MRAGLVDAYGRYLDRVPNASGVMRSGGPRRGKVAVVIGGGSGHYPAFAGLVGAGLADAAVVGDVFTSPSANQAYLVGRSVDGGAGILFSYGNYAGDVLNFGAAEQRLRAEGRECRTVLVTDDVASAPEAEGDQRRGIAGDLIVFKAAGAAAARGGGIDEVERLARKANAATRTLGVAFGACILPGQTEPLFVVEPGSYEIGMGIHGEPGVQSLPTVSVGELARLLVEPLLAEKPADAGDRIAVLLNGLGATKYEELFVLWKQIAPLLSSAGLEVVAPEVGELVTSLDMAGCSLTISWLDHELDELWLAPADAPGFRRGDAASLPKFGAMQVAVDARSSATGHARGSEESRAAAAWVRAALQAMLHTITAHEDELGRIDAVAGDGDHGLGMSRGLRAAVAAASDESTSGAGATLHSAAAAFADQAGGTSGLLWGVLLDAVGEELGDEQPVNAEGVALGVVHGCEAVKRVGGAKRGDKTLVDVLEPFATRLRELVSAGESLADAWREAAKLADAEAEATAALTPRVGRARPLAAKSVGTVDAGAISMALCVNAVTSVLQQARDSRRV